MHKSPLSADDEEMNATMTKPIVSLKVLFDSISDIGTAVRASREYTILSTKKDARRAHRVAVSPLLPN